jgi:hypothetical protein
MGAGTEVPAYLTSAEAPLQRGRDLMASSK